MEYRKCRHVFGNSPFPAIATYSLHRSVEGCDMYIHEFDTKDFYVDDGITSQSNAKKAIDLIKRTQNALSFSSLRLHKIASYSVEVVRCFPQSDLAKDLENVDLGMDLPVQRSLGLRWNLGIDSFVFKVDGNDRPVTKRGTPSCINSMFDPLGILAPVTIVGKLILRDLVAKGYDWD